MFVFYALCQAYTTSERFGKTEKYNLGYITYSGLKKTGQFIT